MNVIDLEILIPASPDFIWRFMGDVAKYVDWQEGVQSISCLTTQREGKGARWRYSTGRGNDVVMEIAAWYDTLGYEYSIVDGAGFSANQGRIRLQEVTDGTLVRWTFNYELSGVLGGLRSGVRHKRSTTKQIQDSLRNLHKLIQKESGGISTHQARAKVREAPDVENRSSYAPRHPSKFADGESGTETELDEDLPMPLLFEYEPMSPPPSVPETDTKPNPVVQVGDIVAGVEEPQSEVEEATRPIDMQIIAYETLDVPEHEKQEREPVDIPEPVPEPAAAFTDIPKREPRAVDTASVSVFEIFGLRKPSEAGGQLLEDESAADRATWRNSLDLPINSSVDDPFGRQDELPFSRLSNVDSGGERDKLSVGDRPKEPTGVDVQITGWRRASRQRLYHLRSHNT